MPIFEFLCETCEEQFEEITPYDKTGKYSKVVCPKCGSKKKEKLMSQCSFNFSNPVGTGRWNSDSTGHDYRFKHNIPNVKKQRKMAEAMSHMGSNPYGKSDDSQKFDTGVHDA